MSGSEDETVPPTTGLPSRSFSFTVLKIRGAVVAVFVVAWARANPGSIRTAASNSIPHGIMVCLLGSARCFDPERGSTPCANFTGQQHIYQCLSKQARGGRFQ